MTLFSVTLGDPNYPKPPHFCYKPALYTKTAEPTELVFSTEASLCISYTVLEGNSGISKNKGTFLHNFHPNSGLWTEISQLYVDRLRCCQRRWAVSVINWWPIHHTDRRRMCTTRWAWGTVLRGSVSGSTDLYFSGLGGAVRPLCAFER